MTLSLNDLPFIDLYVRLDQADQALYRSKEKGKGVISQFVPAEYQPMIDRFMIAVNKEMREGASDGSIDFEGLRCRLSRQTMSDHTSWVCARRINTVIPDIQKLGYQSYILDSIHGLGKRDGLILVSGATGHGKTTTAVAMLADFLRSYGGTAVTIEDPVEFMLKGRHGDGGQCFQVEVHSDEEWAACLKRALRWAPRYIYVGEIRTPKAAEQVLRAATTGHLVITTVHAGSPEEALMGLIFLAEQAMGPGVQNILAAGLTALINQTLKEAGPTVRYLFTEPDSPGDPIRSLIRENKIGMISTYVDRINARLANAPRPLPPLGEGKPMPSLATTPPGSPPLGGAAAAVRK
ncbi:MAG: type IV pilus twitching motility protein PilT [Pseudomonadota bacterium]|nr:type IV pilus twitching motility protein PilT [Pseudomonadota bacterium]